MEISQISQFTTITPLSKNKKVEKFSLPLHDYLAANRGQSGIMAARLSGN